MVLAREKGESWLSSSVVDSGRMLWPMPDKPRETNKLRKGMCGDRESILAIG